MPTVSLSRSRSRSRSYSDSDSSRSRHSEKRFSRGRGENRHASPSNDFADGRENPRPNKVLGVFGLSHKTDERTLHPYFEDAGGKIQEIMLIRDRKTQDSKGYAFIYFYDIESATRARNSMNGKTIEGKEIRVDYSATRKPHPPGSRPPVSYENSGYSNGQRDRDPRSRNAPPNRCIGCFNLSRYTTETELENRFKNFGPIMDIKLIFDRKTNQSKCYSFIYFRDTKSATKAKDYMDGREIDGSVIRVDFSATNARAERGSPPARRHSPEYRPQRRPQRYSPDYERGAGRGGRRRSMSPYQQPRRRSYSPRRRSPMMNGGGRNFRRSPNYHQPDW